jgi:uncharacterized Zn-finger protein
MKEIIELKKNELPAFCPPLKKSLWNLHPKVYIKIHGNKGKCPYCGNEFLIK